MASELLDLRFVLINLTAKFLHYFLLCSLALICCVVLHVIS
jgi:hypothetical protein